MPANMLRRKCILLSLAAASLAVIGFASIGTAIGQEDQPLEKITIAGEESKAKHIGVGAEPPEHAVELISNGGLPVWTVTGTQASDNLTEEQLEELSDEVPVTRGGEGGLETRMSFGDARIHVEWLAPPGGEGPLGGNSGVYIQGRYEIQILNNGPDDELKPTDAGSIYTMKVADENASAGAGQWQSYDIWFKAPRFKDGEKTSAARITLVWNGKLVHDDVEVPSPTGMGRQRGEGAGPETDYQVGPLVLQNHKSTADGPVLFRNVWMAPLHPDGAGEDVVAWSDWRPLDEGDPREAFQIHGGKATFKAQNGTITGTTAPNTPNTFLATKKLYGDFELELELKGDPELNSGVQIRSTTTDGSRSREARVTGYQVEIDPDANRGWSGGLYDEAGRAWLYPLTANPEARQAYKPGDWNTYRIVARGPVIKTYVNDILAAQVFDAARPEGFIALQVHGVGDRQDPLSIQWRNVRVRTARDEKGTSLNMKSP